MKRCRAGRRSSIHSRFHSAVSIAKSLWHGEQVGASLAERRRRGFESRLEQLEPRTLMAADFQITEFMASNDGVLLDQDGDPSDWIEIQNIGDTAGSLAGWHLADDNDDWTFPDVTVQAGAFITVFASGKDRATAGSQLHTNFALAAEGERLALLRPNQSVRQEFNPYPAQLEDVSYGIVQDASQLVPTGAGATMRVPTAGDNGLGTSWTSRTFNDSSWTSSISSGNRSVLITEVSLGTPDWFEIQNVSGQAVNTSGWVVAINDGNGGQSINSLDPILFTIGPSMPAGQIRYRTETAADTANYHGSPIDWPNTGSQGWVMIVNNTGQVVDFVPWGYSALDLASMNVTVNGFTINSSAIANAWKGDPVLWAGTSSNSLQRQGNTDDDNASDWIFRTPTSINAQNAGFTVPVTGASIPVTTGIGFNTNPAGFNVKYFKANVLVGDTFVAEQVIANPNLQSSTATQTVATINYLNTGPGANFGGDIPFPTQIIGPDIDDFVIEATGTIVIPAPGQWTFGVNSDDGFTLQLTNGVNTYNMSFTIPRGPADTLQVFNFASAGTYQARLVFFERGGGAEVELFAAQGSHGSVNSSFKLVGDTLGGGLATAGFGGSINTNVQSQMMNVNSSLWTRIPFIVSNPANLTSLTLRMKYNDGFIAYLNGTEIARHNANSTAWNAAATGTRNDGESVAFVDFNVSQFLPLLQSGQNVLSIHGQNNQAANNTFLVLPELVGTTSQPVLRYFTTPSPGATNIGQGVLGFVGDTVFSHGRGFYTAPFQATISTPTAGAVIRYTLDGSDPSETNGVVYSGPITINRTSTLRASAFLPGYEPSNIDTQTYLFLSDIVTQSEATPPGWPAHNQINGQDMSYGMDPNIVNVAPWQAQMQDAMRAVPSLSIVTPLDNLFDPSRGIYVNARGDGDSWEVPTSFELINPDGSEGFQIDAGLRIRGGFSRSENNPKHAFRLFFRKEYGNGKLDYPLFGSEGSVTSFDKMDLRTAQNYSWSFQGDGSNAMVEEVWNRDTSKEMGQAYTRSRWYHLYINGQYWGLFQTEERPDAAFGSSHFGGEREEWDTVKVDPDLGYNIEATDGDLVAWTQLYTRANAMRNPALNQTQRYAIYQELQGKNPDGSRNTNFPVLLDVDNVIEYMQVIFYSGDRDAPISNFLGNTSPNNWFGIRNRNGQEGFRFIVHDPEHTLTHGLTSRVGPFPAGDGNVLKSSPQWIHQMLMFSDEYRIRFADLARRNYYEMGADSGALTAAEALARFNARTAEIDLAIIGESARWGDSKREPAFTKNNWVSATNNTRNFFNSRAATVINQFRSTTLYGTGAPAPLYPSVEPPQFNQYGGQVAPGFNLLIGSTSGGTIYYTTDGSDPRLVGGGVKPGALVYSGGVPINNTQLINARVLVGAVWSAMTSSQFSVNSAPNASNLAITEINYNPAEPSAAELAINPTFVADSFEWIEIRNIGSGLIDLNGVQFSAGITFNFPATGAPTLDPGESLVLVANQAAFAARYGAGVSVGGVYGGSLANGGEQLTLRTATSELIDDLTFDDTGDWPGRADGDGSSLVIINPAGDPNDPDNWRSSTEYGGSPGALGLAPINSIIVNEVLTHTDLPLVDAVELYNPTAAAVDIGGWYLSDGGTPEGIADGTARYKKFRIPNGTIIQPGAYLVFDEGDFNTTPTHPSFSFNSAEGDDVYLMQADSNGKLLTFVEHVDFGAAANGESFGRWPNATGKLYPMVSRTLGAANSGPRIGPVIINELMYRPQAANDDLEYVELVNITDAPITLAGWKFTNGIDFTFGNTTLPAHGTLLVLRFDPNNAANATKLAAFRAAYPSLPQGAQMVGGYADPISGGVLSDGGETVALSQPDTPQPGGLIPYILVDEVEYDDVAPWPTSPDGTGHSLTRVSESVFGNEPTNWVGAAPTPGGIPSLGIPTDLAATATAPNRIQLNWTDTTSDETGFKIERLDGGNYVEIASVSANVTSYENTNLQSSLNYTYRVRAFNAGGTGEPSNTASATTPQLVTIDGAAADDTYHVLRAGSVLRVYVNAAPAGQPTYSSELAAMNGTLTINAGDGNDAVNVDAGGQPDLGLTQLIYNAGVGANTLALASGSARIDSTAAGGTLNTTVAAGSQLSTALLRQNELVLQGNSRVTLLPAGGTSVVTSLSLAQGATLDIGNNALVVDYSGASPVATIRGNILAGRGSAGLGGTWTGAGITSSAAAQANQTEPESRSVGYAENAQLPLGPYTTFRGQAVDATSVLIAYTRTADATLDGLVNDDDVTVLGASYAPGAAGAVWALGDFEYNGFIDDDDVTLLGVFYNPSAGPLPAPLQLVVSRSPDPVVAWSPDHVTRSTAGLPASAVGLETLGQTNVRGQQTRAQPGQPTAHEDALLDLLAEAVLISSDSLADSRLGNGRRLDTGDPIWADGLWRLSPN